MSSTIATTDLNAASFTLVQGGYTDNAEVTVTFTGTDNDNNGQLESFAGEITDFAFSFSGNSVVSSFTLISDDLWGLVFDLDGTPLGDSISGAVEGVGAGEGNYVTGPGPLLNLCDGNNICGQVDFGGATDTTLIALGSTLYVIDGETIYENGSVASGGYFDHTVAGNGNSPAQRNALRLDNFIGTGMDDFKDAIDGATDEEIAQAIDQLETKLAGAGVGAAKQTAQAIAKIVRQRVNTARGANSGEEMFTEQNFWFKPFGTWGKQKDKGDQNGYDVDTYGFGIGIDGTNKDDQQFGAAFFYNNSDVEVNDADQGADIDGYTLMGYGSIPVIDAKTKFLYQLSYSWQKTDTARDTVLGTAKADYTSKVGSIDLSLMRDYQVNEQWLLQPTVGVTYTHFSTPSYSENGAGVANSDVDKFTTSEFLLNIGTIANYTIDESSKFIATLDLNYDMQDKNDSISATTQGGLELEDTKSIDNGRFGYAVGLGYEKELTNNSNINFSYEYAGEGSRYSTNTVSAKYVLTF